MVTGTAGVNVSERLGRFFVGDDGGQSAGDRGRVPTSAIGAGLRAGRPDDGG
jgi:hypothetical protein